MPFRRALLSIFILIAAIPDAGSSEPVTLPGGVWAIVPPPGFEITPDPIVAFRHPAPATTSVITSWKSRCNNRLRRFWRTESSSNLALRDR